MKFKLGRKVVKAGPGERIVAPAGISHKFANAGDGPAVLRVEVRPALRMEDLWETATALAAEGRTFRNGMPKPLDLALFMHEFEHEVRAPFAPGLVKLTMLPALWAAHASRLELPATTPRLRIPAYA